MRKPVFCQEYCTESRCSYGQLSMTSVLSFLLYTIHGMTVIIYWLEVLWWRFLGGCVWVCDHDWVRVNPLACIISHWQFRIWSYLVGGEWTLHRYWDSHQLLWAVSAPCLGLQFRIPLCHLNKLHCRLFFLQWTMLFLRSSCMILLSLITVLEFLIVKNRWLKDRWKSRSWIKYARRECGKNWKDRS